MLWRSGAKAERNRTAASILLTSLRPFRHLSPASSLPLPLSPFLSPSSSLPQFPSLPFLTFFLSLPVSPPPSLSLSLPSSLPPSSSLPLLFRPLSEPAKTSPRRQETASLGRCPTILVLTVTRTESPHTGMPTVGQGTRPPSSLGSFEYTNDARPGPLLEIVTAVTGQSVQGQVRHRYYFSVFHEILLLKGHKFRRL